MVGFYSEVKKNKNMENPKAAAVARLKEANNVLVTVSNNPSVDQLAGAIGLTLLLNKLGKHATAVFSGAIPSTIEFLQPEQTLESNTDSLRDFIIALDKSKADKLRYKVEEKQVRIFITPYRTSLSEEDLDFSHGDFNVDVVVALGVHEQQDLDQAIVGHGRILHDATILTVNTQPNGSLGTISWVNEQASSLCEMLTDIGIELRSDVLDGQMATALLTGIVAETERFSNQHTSSQTMNISAKLMAAGANQQLVATQLQTHQDEVRVNSNQTENSNDDQTAAEKQDPDEDADDGSLRISHDDSDDDSLGQQASEQDSSGEEEQIVDDPEDKPRPEETTEDPETSLDETKSRMITEPPSMGGALTASGLPEDTIQSTDPLSLPPVDAPLLSHDAPQSEHDAAHEPPTIEPTQEQTNQSQEQESLSVDEVLSQTGDVPADTSDDQNTGTEMSDQGQTLTELEQSIDSPHTLGPEATNQPIEATNMDSSENDSDLDAARAAVSQAVSGESSDSHEPLQAQDGQPVNLDSSHKGQDVSNRDEAQHHQHEYLDVTKLDENTGLLKEDDSKASGLPNTSNAYQSASPPPPLMPPPMMPPSMAYGEQPLPNSENDNQQQDPLAPL